MARFSVMTTQALIFLVAGLLLTGCAAQPTPYMPRTNGTGYSQQQLDSRTWRVQFAGNTSTPRETVENYLLYRCAEIMLFGGYDKFVLLEKDVERNVEYYSYEYPPRYGFGYPYERRYGPYYDLSPAGPVRYSAETSYIAIATIQVYLGEAIEGRPTIYDAHELVRQLGPTIVPPAAKP
jgi:hypothetical protein